MMTLEELLERLELDSPADFEYFEHFAELMELAEEIPYEHFYAVLAEAPADTLAQLADNYFEDILQGIPDNTIDIYTLLTSIRQNLFSLAQNAGNPDVRRQFADELYKFKNWYTQEELVHCIRLSDQAPVESSLCEALALYRLEKLNEDQYDYDFADCLDYDLPEYTVSLGTPEFLDHEPDEAGCDCGHEHHHEHIHSHLHHGHEACGCDHDRDVMEDGDDEDGTSPVDPFADGLIDPDRPVIDGEYEDDIPENDLEWNE